MTNNQIVAPVEPPTRRRFVWAVGFLSIFTAISAVAGFRLPRKKDILRCGPETAKKTIKMLTQDGKLVEIDASLLTAASKKITDGELQQWIKK